MTTEELTVETITELTQEIWSALLADEGTLMQSDAVEGGRDELAATVKISGAWNGLALISCSTVAGRLAAAAMFGMEDEELSSDEVADAVGELVNVVGGNIKGLLPGPTELSLPVVYESATFTAPTGLELAQEVRFSWLAQPVVVAVWSDAN